MSLNTDTPQKFSHITIALHWVIAISIIALIAVGMYMEEMPDGQQKYDLILLHKSFGVIILALAVIRVAWRYINKFPVPLSDMPKWQEKLASVTHWFLLIATLLMPISGMIMSVGAGYPVAVFGLELIAGTGVENKTMASIGHVMHGTGGNLLILFILLHIAGAVKHQFIDKDGTLSRMLGKPISKDSE